MWILTLSWKADREGRSLQLHLAPSYVPCAENKSWLRLKLEVVWELKTFIRDYIEKENVAIWFSKLDLIVLIPSPPLGSVEGGQWGFKSNKDAL